jgi:AraC-like DNA-binding protein
MVPLRYDGDTVTLNGVRGARSNAVLAPGGLEFAAIAPDSLGWAAIALPMSLLEELAELAPPTVRQAARVQMLDLPGASLSRLSAVLGAAARLSSTAPAALALPGTPEALAASIREAMMEALAPGISVVPQRRALRDAMRVVRDAEAFLHAHPDRPLHRDDLCTALGVSRRKLHDAFVATVGLTPPSYLKIRRLTLARRALQATPRQRSWVKSIALAHGFWHLGYFATDYRELFGELPSETLGSAPPHDARDDHRRLRAV